VNAEGKHGKLRKGDLLGQALAVLITCTRNKARPRSLMEVANWLEIAVMKLGSYSAVAERIGLSSQMLRQFSYVRRLTGKVQRLFESRKLDSVDAATHLAMLPARDQEAIANALVGGGIDTIDLRAVVELRRADKSTPIGALLRQVMDSKVRQQYVAEFVVRGSRDRGQLLAAFSPYIPLSEIVALELQGALGRIVLTQKGKQALAEAARTLETPLKHIIPRILNN